MLSTITKIIVFIVVLSVLGAVIPDAVTTNVDGAVRYFVGQLYALNTFLNAATLIACMQALIVFFTGVVIFIIFRWFLKLTGGGN